MRKVSMPRLEKRIPPPFSPEDVKALLVVCKTETPMGLRDRAMILALPDSGLGAIEFVSLTGYHTDTRSALVAVLGKGGKQRQVRLGATTRKSILRYLDLVNKQCQIVHHRYHMGQTAQSEDH